MDGSEKPSAILIPESKEGAIPIEQNLCYQCFQPRTQEQGPCPHCGYDPAKDEGRWPSALHPGSILNGKYILGRVLGQGGFGITYLAFDHVLRIRVAVKEYFPGALASRMPGTTLVNPLSPGSQDEFRYGAERFLEEARILASLAGNPGVVNVSSFFEENATAYFVMEYLEGVSLQAYLREKGGRIPWQEALRILVPVMQSLAPVHRQGLLHRDIAPDNIFLAKNGVKLIDFGAARYSLGDRSRSLDVILKAGYAPKEQYSRKGRQGPWTDVYSLAATLYAAVTGYVPPESLDRLDGEALPSFASRGVSVPPAFEQAVFKGMEVRAEDRFQSMDEFFAAVRPLLGAQPSPQPSPQPQPAQQAVQQQGDQAYRQPQPGSQTYQQPQPGSQTYQQPQPGPQTYQQPQPGPQTYQQPQPGPQTYQQPFGNVSPGKQPNTQRRLAIALGAAAGVIVLLFCVFVIPSFLTPNRSSVIAAGDAASSKAQEDSSKSSSSRTPAILGGSSSASPAKEEKGAILVFSDFEEDAETVASFLESLGYDADEKIVAPSDFVLQLEAEVTGVNGSYVVVTTVSGEDVEDALTLADSVYEVDPENWMESFFLVNVDEELESTFLREFELATGDLHVEGMDYNGNTYYGYINDSRLPEGTGYCSYEDSTTYYGEWKDGLFEGYGILDFASGNRYQGEFLRDEYHGIGTYTWTNGDRFEGEFANGVRNGQGTMTFADGDVYEGGYVDDVMSGKGVYTWPDGDKYEGDFADGQITGHGVYTWSDGRWFEGEFVNGERNGPGTMHYTDGTSTSGTWKDDELVE